MTVAYFDCFAGAGGDMVVGALLDAGADFASLRRELAKLGIPGCDVQAESVYRGGIAGTRFSVDRGDDTSHRHLSDILELIESAELAPRAGRRAADIFKNIARAEAHVHGCDVEKIHFHEVGAADSIMDIVGACVALDMLEIDEIYCSPVPLGSGTVECDHGIMPVPAPATVELLRERATFAGPAAGEVTTPTAAAIFTTLAESFGEMPAMELRAVGYGAGTREGGPIPNLLRVLIGSPQDCGQVDTVFEVSANLDDCTGEIVGRTIELLLEAGCLDAWVSPVYAKKMRPAWVLSALCAPGDVETVETILFRETTTFGVRKHPASRSKLIRRFETVETPYGPIRVKIGCHDGATVTVAPEFDECSAAAQTHNAPVKDVLRAAKDAFRQGGER